MLFPSIAFVVLIAWLGIYVASFLYIAAFMLWQGKYGWLPALGVSAGLPIVLFLVFEKWFLVPLPKGPIEHLLGF
jgi:Na+(H+)/acetate symporter ActP